VSKKVSKMEIDSRGRIKEKPLTTPEVEAKLKHLDAYKRKRRRPMTDADAFQTVRSFMSEGGNAYIDDSCATPGVTVAPPWKKVSSLSSRPIKYETKKSDT